MAEIFLLEDSVSLRRILIRQLRDAGHNVTAFEDGDVSRDRDLIEQADAVVTDLDMPRIDGKTAIRNILWLRPDLPVIVITGVDTREIDLPRGVAFILRKPFTETDLVTAVEIALSSRSGAQDEAQNDNLSAAPVSVTGTTRSPNGVDASRLRVALVARLRSIVAIGPRKR